MALSNEKLWYEYALQQIAAESYLDQFTRGNRALVDVLIDGNNDQRKIRIDQFRGFSRMTNSQAQIHQFGVGPTQCFDSLTSEAQNRGPGVLRSYFLTAKSAL